MKGHEFIAKYPRPAYPIVMKHRGLCLGLGLCLLFLGFLTPQKAQADMDPRVKAMAAMAAYGTVGGALLGTASLAFGAEGRSVAIGASLGLYAGLIFGSYVIVSHRLEKNNYYQRDEPVRRDYYPDDSFSPYQSNPADGAGPYDGGFGRIQVIKDLEFAALHDRKELERMSGLEVDRPSFQMNLIRVQF